MEHLRRGDHKEAFEQFKYAEAALGFFATSALSPFLMPSLVRLFLRPTGGGSERRGT